ncbi:MAG TPA: YhjD/YihY/BrkB family envelope integrity protein [Verrucomicrobiae bacterium]|jgi:membrane protein
MKVRSIFGLFKTAAKDFSADSAPRLGASLAYYTIFSLSPLLIIVIAIASFLMGSNSHAGQKIYDEIASIVGPKGAEAIQSLMNQPGAQKQGLISSIIAVVTLILGSSGVFIELQAALNKIWDVKQEPGAGIWGFIKHRLLSFAMVLTIGFLLLVSLVVTAAISALGGMVGKWMPSLEAISQILNFVASFGIITVLFACIFKFMPDVRIPWKTVWVGAAVTSLLFAIGKFGLGMYLGKNTASNAFGPAKSLVILLLWVYYSAQIMFFGAELTQAYAKLSGAKVEPKEHARTDEENTSKEVSPTKPSPASAPAPERVRPAPYPRPKPGFVMPALLLLVAIFLPNAHKRHS